MSHIELTADELAIIEQRREEAANRQRKHLSKEIERETHNQRVATNEAKQICDMANALEDADTNNIFTIVMTKVDHTPTHIDAYSTKQPTITCTVGSQKINIEIATHRTSRGSTHFSSVNKGLKYLRSGSLTNYNQRWYKTPKRLIASIKKFQEAHTSNVTEEQTRATLRERARTSMEERYPNAEVTYEGGYESGRFPNIRRKPNRIKVSTDNGSIEFTYYDKEGQVVFGTWSRSVGKTISDKVEALILG